MIYVMSDIHGNLRRFNSILEQIKLTDKDTLYVLGDVIDRYPDGIRILRKLMAMDNVFPYAYITKYVTFVSTAEPEPLKRPERLVGSVMAASLVSA